MIVRYTGGLGNQMFQYAFGKAYAKKYGCDLKFDDFSYVRDKKRKLEIDALKLSNKEILSFPCKIFFNALFYLKMTKATAFVKEKESFWYEDINSSFKRKYYIGDWQNIKYFSEIRNELQEEFTVETVPERIRALYNEIKENHCSVAIHVRRGDYQQIPGYVVQNKDYFIRAMDYMSSKLENPTFYIFSDDPDWCQENLLDTGSNKVLVLGNSAIEDFTLMRECNNFIISNSTFSWWPAFLSDSGIKIAPVGWFTNSIIDKRVNQALLEKFLILES